MAYPRTLSHPTAFVGGKPAARRVAPAITFLAVCLAAPPAGAEPGSITASASPSIVADFDIVNAAVRLDGNLVTFSMTVAGAAGDTHPESTGVLQGSSVYSYVWPTSIDPSVVGFGAGAGRLALAVTVHPDFDDTPLFDENNDGDTANDGDHWHSHWVVLAPIPACGEGALGVVDIPSGELPPLPPTWPGLPILIDSPGWDPILSGQIVSVTVPFGPGAIAADVSFDGVTAGLRVSEQIHVPLLCVADVFDVASGDLSLPGRVDR